MVELKYDYHPMNLDILSSSNRTMVELKFKWITIRKKTPVTSNRTMVELKYVPPGRLESVTDFQSYHGGIEIY